MNMSYCRFENTYGDLLDCLEALREAGSIKALESDTNARERPFMRNLVALCRDVIEEFGDDLDSEPFQPKSFDE